MVVWSEPFHLTTELLMKSVPFTVRVKAGFPAILPVGESMWGQS